MTSEELDTAIAHTVKQLASLHPVYDSGARVALDEHLKALLKIQHAGAINTSVISSALVKIPCGGAFAWIKDRRVTTEPRRKRIAVGMPACQTRGMGGRYPHTSWGRRSGDKDAYYILRESTIKEKL